MILLVTSSVNSERRWKSSINGYTGGGQLYQYSLLSPFFLYGRRQLSAGHYVLVRVFRSFFLSHCHLISEIVWSIVT